MTKSYQWMFRILTLCYCLGMFFYAPIYSFMGVNVFLAYLPTELSFHLKKIKGSNYFYLFFMLWILFYPNAPYLFTDFFHLELVSIYQGPNQIFLSTFSEWLSFGLLTIGICVWGFLGMSSFMEVIEECYKRRILKTKIQGSLFFIIVNLCSSLAIFVGRFDRLHSVHLFTKPFQTVETIFFTWSFNKVGFILILTLVQISLFFALYAIRYSKNNSAI